MYRPMAGLAGLVICLMAWGCREVPQYVRGIPVEDLRAARPPKLPTAGPAKVPTAGLVAWYRFEGDAKDSSGQDNHGTANGCVNYVKGVVGQAARFGGYDNRGWISVPNSASLRFAEAATFAFWFKQNGRGGMANDGSGRKADRTVHVIIGKSLDGAGLAVHTDMQANGQSHIALNKWGTIYGILTTRQKVSEWVHIAIVAGKQGTKMYENGTLASSNELPVDLSEANRQNLYLGAGANGAWYPLDGEIDELRIYGLALTDAQIEALAAVGGGN